MAAFAGFLAGREAARYLAWRVLPGMVEQAGAALTYIPCLLGGIFKATGNQAPMQAFAGIKGKLEYQWLEMKRFIERHGLHEFSMNPHFPINTLLITQSPQPDRGVG